MHYARMISIVERSQFLLCCEHNGIRNQIQKHSDFNGTNMRQNKSCKYVLVITKGIPDHQNLKSYLFMSEKVPQAMQ